MEAVTEQPPMRLTVDDMVDAGVTPENAYQHRVTDGCTGVPFGAWVGIDTQLSGIEPGEMYLICRDGQHQVRHLWAGGEVVKIGKSPRGPTAEAWLQDVEVVGRVFWVGYVRRCPWKTMLEHTGTEG